MGWSRREEALLCRLYEAKVSADVMTGALGKSYGAIHVKACRMGITTGKKKRHERATPVSGEDRSPEDRRRFRRLLELLVWCKLRTGLSSKEVVNAVLGDGEEGKRWF
jgi:hypothetical protein